MGCENFCLGYNTHLFSFCVLKKDLGHAFLYISSKFKITSCFQYVWNVALELDV